MKIRRFYAPDNRQAIRQVREVLGTDAVILSNRRTDDGIEIVAAIDYNEQLLEQSVTSADLMSAASPSEAEMQPPLRVKEPISMPAAERPRIVWSQEPAMKEMRQEILSLRGLMQSQLSGLAWGDLAKSQPLRVELLRRLMAMGLSPRLSHALSEATRQDGDESELWRDALGQLAAQLPIADDPVVNGAGVVALIGPTGVGKTTTLAKLAARAVLRFGRQQVAIISTDNFRIGANDQLNSYGRILDVPVRVARDGEELAAAIKSFADRRLVLVDTAGISQRDQRLTQQFAMLSDVNMDLSNYLVISATSQQQGLDEIVKVYSRLQLAGCILTKVDEAASLGGGLSVAIEHGLPIAYVSDGQHVPEDLHLARRNNLVNRATGLMKSNYNEVEDTLLAMTLGGLAVNAQF